MSRVWEMNIMKIQESVSLEKFLRVQMFGVCWDIPSKVKDNFPIIKKEAQSSLNFKSRIYHYGCVLLTD